MRSVAAGCAFYIGADEWNRVAFKQNFTRFVFSAIVGGDNQQDPAPADPAPAPKMEISRADKAELLKMVKELGDVELLEKMMSTLGIQQ